MSKVENEGKGKEGGFGQKRLKVRMSAIKRACVSDLKIVNTGDPGWGVMGKQKFSLDSFSRKETVCEA